MKRGHFSVAVSILDRRYAGSPEAIPSVLARIHVAIKKGSGALVRNALSQRRWTNSDAETLNIVLPVIKGGLSPIRSIWNSTLGRTSRSLCGCNAAAADDDGNEGWADAAHIAGRSPSTPRSPSAHPPVSYAADAGAADLGATCIDGAGGT